MRSGNIIVEAIRIEVVIKFMKMDNLILGVYSKRKKSQRIIHI